MHDGAASPGVSSAVVSGTPAQAGALLLTTIGNPAVRVAPPTRAPVMALPALSAVVAPLASFMPQRPSRSVWAPVISESLAARMSAPDRATLQIRTSSTTPAKKPAAAFAVVSALPTVVRELVWALAGLLTARVPSSAPSR